MSVSRRKRKPAAPGGAPTAGGAAEVFVALGFPPEEARHLALKAWIAHHIVAEIDRRGLSQGEAAKALGVDQPKISQLRRERYFGVSVERLFQWATRLGLNVEIGIRRAAKGRRGRLSLVRPAALSRRRRVASAAARVP